jgi:hypothetical protein
MTYLGQSEVLGEKSAMWNRFGNGVLESWKSKSQLLLAEQRAAMKMDVNPMKSMRRFCQKALF